jgi:hypothetical protein
VHWQNNCTPASPMNQRLVENAAGHSPLPRTNCVTQNGMHALSHDGGTLAPKTSVTKLIRGQNSELMQDVELRVIEVDIVSQLSNASRTPTFWWSCHDS